MVPEKKKTEDIFTHTAYVKPYEYNNMYKQSNMIWHISMKQ